MMTTTQIKSFDCAEDIFQSHLSPAKLIALSGVSSLDKIDFLEIKVDSRQIGLSSLGKHVPHLRQLKLNNSFIPRIRDLGTGFNHLRVLWMARCELEDIDSIGSLQGLHELYLANNQISDISSIGMLEDLEILDLESNEISDLDQIEHLALCRNLHDLTLEGNPLNFGTLLDKEVSPLHDEHHTIDELDTTQERARQIIFKMLPGLHVLDDISVKRANVDEKDNVLNEGSTHQTSEVERPKTSYGRAKSPRPFDTTVFESDASMNVSLVRPATAHGRSSGAQRPRLADASSNLTFGTDMVFGGNPVMLLRARRRDGSLPVLASHTPDRAISVAKTTSSARLSFDRNDTPSPLVDSSSTYTRSTVHSADRDHAGYRHEKNDNGNDGQTRDSPTLVSMDHKLDGEFAPFTTSPDVLVITPRPPPTPPRIDSTHSHHRRSIATTPPQQDHHHESSSGSQNSHNTPSPQPPPPKSHNVSPRRKHSFVKNGSSGVTATTEPHSTSTGEKPGF